MSEEIAKLIVNIDANVTDVVKGLSLVNASILNLGSVLASASSSYTKSSNKMGTATKDLTRLTIQTSLVQKDYVKALQLTEAAIAKGGQSEEELLRLEQLRARSLQGIEREQLSYASSITSTLAEQRKEEDALIRLAIANGNYVEAQRRLGEAVANTTDRTRLAQLEQLEIASSKALQAERAKAAAALQKQAQAAKTAESVTRQTVDSEYKLALATKDYSAAEQVLDAEITRSAGDIKRVNDLLIRKVQLDNLASDAVVEHSEKISLFSRIMERAAGYVFGQLIIGSVRRSEQAFKDMVGTALDSYKSLEQLGMSLQTYVAQELQTKDASLSMADALNQAGGRAKELQSWIVQLAVQSPIKEEDVAKAFQLSLAYGFTTDQAQRLVQVLIDFEAAGHAGAADNVARALGQIGAKAKLSAQDMHQLEEQGINVRKILSESLHVSTQEFERLQKAGIDSKVALEAIVNTLENQYQGAAERATHTFSGLVDQIEDLGKIRLRDVFSETFSNLKPIMEDIVGLLSSPDFVNGLKAFGQDLGSVATDAIKFLAYDAIPAIVSGVKSITPAAKEVWTLFSNLASLASSVASPFLNILIPSLNETIKIFTEIVNFLNTNFSPIIGGITTAIIFYTASSIAASVATGGFTASIMQATTAAEIYLASLTPLIAALATIALPIAAVGVAGAVAVKTFNDLTASTTNQARALVTNREWFKRSQVALEDYAKSSNTVKEANKDTIDQLLKLRQEADVAAKNFLFLGRGIKAFLNPEGEKADEQAFIASMQARGEAIDALLKKLPNTAQAAGLLDSALGKDSFGVFSSIIDEAGRKITAATKKFTEDNAAVVEQFRTNFWDSLASLEAAIKIQEELDKIADKATSAADQLAEADINFFESSQKRAIDHAEKMRILEIQLKNAKSDGAAELIQEKIQQEKDGYLEEEKTQLISYMRQEAELKRHLGVMLIEYVTQLAAGNSKIAENIDVITDRISTSFGIQETAGTKMVASYIKNINAFAQGTVTNLDQVDLSMDNSRQTAMGYEMQLRNLEDKFVSQIVMDMDQKQITDVNQMRGLLDTWPTFLQTNLFLDISQAIQAAAALGGTLNAMGFGVSINPNLVGSASGGKSLTQSYKPSIPKASTRTPSGTSGGGSAGSTARAKKEAKSEKELAQDAAKAAADTAKSVEEAILKFQEVSDVISKLKPIDQSKLDIFASQLAMTLRIVSEKLIEVNNLLLTKDYKDLADNAKATMDLVSSAVDAFSKFKDLELPMQESITSFATTLEYTVSTVADVVNRTGSKFLEFTGDWLDTASKVVDLVAQGVDALTKLKDYGGVGKDQIWSFAMSLADAVEYARIASLQYGTQLTDEGKNWVKTATDVVALYSAGAEAFKNLNEYKGVPKDNLWSLIQSIADAVEMASERAKTMEPKLMEAAKAFGETAGAVIQPIGEGIKAFEGLEKFSGVPRHQLELLMAALELTTQMMIAMSTRMDQDSVAAAAKFAESVDKVLQPVKTALDTFKDLDKYKGTPQAVFYSLDHDIQATIQLMQYLSSVYSTDGLKAAVEFSESAGKIFGAFKNVIDSLQGLESYKNVAGDRFQAVKNDFTKALNTIKDMAWQAQQFEMSAGNWQTALVNAANAIKAGVDAVASLNGVNVDVTAHASINASGNSGASQAQQTNPQTLATPSPQTQAQISNKKESNTTVNVHATINNDMDAEVFAYKIAKIIKKRSI